MNDKFCVFCDWYELFGGVCCNGESPNRVEFMDEFDSCDKWEEAEKNDRYRKINAESR